MRYAAIRFYKAGSDGLADELQFTICEEHAPMLYWVVFVSICCPLRSLNGVAVFCAQSNGFAAKSLLVIAAVVPFGYHKLDRRTCTNVSLVKSTHK